MKKALLERLASKPVAFRCLLVAVHRMESRAHILPDSEVSVIELAISNAAIYTSFFFVTFQDHLGNITI